MRQVSVEALLAKVSPRFALVSAVAARAEQLIRGDIPALETNTRNPVLVAMDEIALGKLHVVTKRSAGTPPRELESTAPPSGGHPVEVTLASAEQPLKASLLR